MKIHKMLKQELNKCKTHVGTSFNFPQIVNVLKMLRQNWSSFWQVNTMLY